MKKSIRKILDKILKENPDFLADACWYYLEEGEINTDEYAEYAQKYRESLYNK